MNNDWLNNPPLIIFQVTILTMAKILIAYLLFVQTALTQSIYTPISDGDVYITGSVQQSGILVPGPTIHSIIMFSAFSSVPDYQYSLMVSQYALPGGGNIDVYGFASPDGVIQGSDFNTGTYLGTIVLPSNLTYGQSMLLDVSSFIFTDPGPYFAFNLRDTAGNGLSSLAQNYGTPPELIATPVPEPSVSALLILSMATIIGFARVRTKPNNENFPFGIRPINLKRAAAVLKCGSTNAATGR
jgi:hypothetical protein